MTSDNKNKRVRIIPSYTVPKNFADVFPNQVEDIKLSSQDEKLLSKISEEYNGSKKSSNELVGASLEEIEEMLRVAEAGAKLERDLNPEFYKNFVEHIVEDSAEQNPFSDGLDDFGNVFYTDEI